MEINPNVENLEANSTSEDEVWGMPKYQQNYLSNLTNLTDEQYLAVVKFVFSKKATKIDKIFTVDLTLVFVFN